MQADILKCIIVYYRVALLRILVTSGALLNALLQYFTLPYILCSIVYYCVLLCTIMYDCVLLDTI